MEKLWTTAEVAKFLGVDVAQVEQLVKDGVLAGYQLGGQFLRFRPDQVGALKGRIQPTRSSPQGPKQDSRLRQIFDFCQFYDFYILSAALLAVLVVYLVVSW